MSIVDDWKSAWPQPIAIVGIGCRFPGGVKDAASFWSLLRAGRNAITEIPRDRWSLDGFYDPAADSPYRSYSKWGGFLDDIAGFDPEFFGLSRSQAEAMDPQQRILLEVAYEAAEDAAIPLERLRAQPTGVYVGASNPDYGLLQRFEFGVGDIGAGTGTAMSIIANRISNVLDLNGPSMGIDTACSSSLVALDAACRALRDGSVDIALTGGVNVLLDPRMFLTFCRAHMLSRAGRIAAFDAGADGFVRGEGAGLVVLKRLGDALADGHRIYAAIEATAVNQDGRTDSITAPNPDAQKSMIRAALAVSNVAAAEIDYVEAHGTGTPLGDPIEAEAIGEVLGLTERMRPVLIGTVKENIGHLEPAAGIAGLIKAALVLARGEIPPNLNFETPNPRIPFASLNIEIVRDRIALDPARQSRALVNSFGFGGTNACAVLRRQQQQRLPARPHAVSDADTFATRLVPIPISAPTKVHLATWAAALAAALRDNSALAGLALRELAAGLVRQRSHFKHRAVVLARDHTDLVSKLTAIAEGREWQKADKNEVPAVITGAAVNGRKPKRVFTCTGQGGQFWNMGRDFLASHPAFRRFVCEFDALFVPTAGWSVLEVLSAEENDSRLHDPAVTPAAMFALQGGLAQVWNSVGVTPDLLIGHSFGEVTAAYLAGAIELADVAHLVNHRGLIRRHIDRVGTMAAIGLGASELAHLLRPGEIEIGAYNAPNMVTLSGDRVAIEDLIAQLRARDPNILARLLDLDFAWHSSWLDPGRTTFLNAVGRLPWHPPKIPVISTVTGEIETRFDTDYWWRNLRFPVRFDRAVEHAIDEGATSFIEIGPTRTLSSPTAAGTAAKGSPAVTVTTLQRGQDNFASFAAAMAQLYVAGEDVAWEGLFGYACTAVALPPMPFLPERLWTVPEEAAQRLFAKPSHALLGANDRAPGHHWSSTVSLSAYPVLGDHRIMGSCILPAAVMIVIMHAAAMEIFGARPIELADLRLPGALFLTNDDRVALHTEFDAERGRIRIWSRRKGSAEDWILRAAASLFVCDSKLRSIGRPPDDTLFNDIDVTDFYAAADRNGYHFGPAFRGITRLAGRTDAVRADVGLPDGHASGINYAPLDPRLLDSCLQAIIACLDRLPGNAGKLMLPEAIDRIVVTGALGATAHVEARMNSSGEERAAAFSMSIADADGIEQIRITGLHARAVETQTSAEAADAPAFIDESAVEIPVPSPTHDLVIRDWLVLSAPHGGNAGTLGNSLAAKGQKVFRADWNGASADASDAIACLAAAARRGAVTAIAYVVPLDLVADGDWPTATAIAGEVARLVEFGQILVSHSDCGPTPPDIWIITRHGRRTGPAEPGDPASLVQYALLGAARTLAIECAAMRFHLLDLDSAALAASETVADVMSVRDAESELAIRHGKLLAPRLNRKRIEDIAARSRPANRLPSEHGFALGMDATRGIDGLHWHEDALAALRAGEARVRVRAAGLNFRDVMLATGLLPKAAEQPGAALGLEFCGVVENIGSAVEAVAPGDRVLGIARGSLRRSVTIEGDRLHRVPVHLSDAEAASIPAVYLTAHYVLSRLGRLRAGDAVLVHSGAGGLGLAAIALAKHCGADVFATAGSPNKRTHLARLGVRAVLDSRSLSFAEEILQATDGRGVDLVLNALPGPFIEKGLACLAPYGRFIELGKRDVYGDRSFGLKALRRNVSLHVVDIAALLEERPYLAHEMMREVLKLFEDHTLAPPPVKIFPAEQVNDAFRTFAEARHIGKIAIDLHNAAPRVRVSRDDYPVDSRSAYLVTGGLSGFGFAVARQLTEAGAGRIVIASRSGIPSREAEQALAQLRQGGAELVTLALDVADTGAVETAIAGLVNSDRPLRGIVHASAVYADALLPDMTPDMIRRVLAPKIGGGLNLTRAALKSSAQLDFFLSISSLAQVVGWRGQINYAAANAALETLAHAQRHIGIPGSCLNLGMLGETGFVSRRLAMMDYLTSAGWQPLSNEQALFAVRTALASEAAVLIFSATDWQRLSQSEAALARSERIRPMIADAAGTAGADGLIRLSPAARKAAAAAAIRSAVAAVLRLDPNIITASDGLGDLGLDSLSTFELWHRVEAALVMPIPLARFTQASTVDALADLACDIAAEIAGTAMDDRVSGKSCDAAQK